MNAIFKTHRIFCKEQLWTLWLTKHSKGTSVKISPPKRWDQSRWYPGLVPKIPLTGVLFPLPQRQGTNTVSPVPVARQWHWECLWAPRPGHLCMCFCEFPILTACPSSSWILDLSVSEISPVYEFWELHSWLIWQDMPVAAMVAQTSWE